MFTSASSTSLKVAHHLHGLVHTQLSLRDFLHRFVLLQQFNEFISRSLATLTGSTGIFGPCDDMHLPPNFRQLTLTSDNCDGDLINHDRISVAKVSHLRPGLHKMDCITIIYHPFYVLCTAHQPLQL